MTYRNPLLRFHFLATYGAAKRSAHALARVEIFYSLEWSGSQDLNLLVVSAPA